MRLKRRFLRCSLFSSFFPGGSIKSMFLWFLCFVHICGEGVSLCLVFLEKIRSERSKACLYFATAVVSFCRIYLSGQPISLQYNILITTYKASHLLAPNYLTNLLEFYQPIRTLWSSSESLLVVHRAHLRQHGDRAFDLHRCSYTMGIISHAIRENVTQQTSLKDSLKLTYSKKLFTDELWRTFNIVARLDVLCVQDLFIYFIILSFFQYSYIHNTLLFISIIIS